MSSLLAATLASAHGPPALDAPAPPPAIPHNVPTALSSFVGRVREVASVRAALAGARLLTLTGPGGAGKTRLAREVAAAAGALTASAPEAAAPAYPDGVWWVELAPVAAPDDVAPAVAGVLGVRLASDRAPASAIADALRGRRVLLVLDNCEHVIGASAALAEALLRACPALTVLATSREALAVEGEAAWVVPPLAHPERPIGGGANALDLSLGPTADEVGAYDAVRLFVERARGVQPAFALTDRNAEAVAAICARLDGVPLALELAAAHVSALGVEALALRLDDVLGLLTRGRRTAAPRHQTLRALLDWSYALLAPAEQALLCRLSVFRDAATLDAVAAVCGAGPGGGDADTLAALSRLVEQSLVQVRDDADASGGEVRYALLETVRQYGAERLAGTAEEIALRDRHLAWAADHVARAEPRLWSARWVEESARLAPVLDDLRAAVQWAAVAAPDGGASSPADAARVTAALDVAGGLIWYWFAAGNFAEGIRLVESALQAADAEGLAVGAAPVRRPSPGASPAARRAVLKAVTTLLGLNFIADRRADILAASQNAVALWDAERAASETGGRRDAVARQWTAYARINLAEAHLLAGDPAAALAVGAANVDEARALGGRDLALALMRRGYVRFVTGDPDGGRPALEEAAALFGALGDVACLALTEQTLAELGIATGDLVAAAAQVRTALRTQRDLATPWILVRTLDLPAQLVLAGALPGAGADAAARLLGAAAGIRRRAGIEVVYFDRSTHDRTVARAAEALGDAAFRAAWAEGERLDLHAARAYAAAMPWPAAAPGAPAVVSNAPAPRANGAFPAAAAPARPAPARAGGTLALRVLGPPVLARNAAAPEALPGGKVAELLVWLVVTPSGTKEQIGLDLWPDASPAQLRSIFHITLHHVRRLLGDRGWVAQENGRYRLARAVADAGGPDAARLACDADDLFAAADGLRAAARARAPLDDAALDAARQLLARCGGELAEGFAAGDWLERHRARARAAWDDGMAVVAHALAAGGRYAEALAAYQAVLARDPTREAAHRAVMACHAAAGEPARALAHYDALVALLARELGARPARETQDLAERLRAA